MATISLVTANRVRVVRSDLQDTLIAGLDLTAGQAVIIDPTTGKAVLARGTTAPLARVFGIVMKRATAGMGVDILRAGIMDGFDLSAQAYDKELFISDTLGVLGDVAGTVSKTVGRVLPANAVTLGTAPDKLLLVELT